MAYAEAVMRREATYDDCACIHAAARNMDAA
jgi:hypothetical protein